MEEHRDLDELDNGARQLAKPVGGKADQKAALGLIVDGLSSSDVLVILMNPLVETGLPWAAGVDEP
jgi:hypothetical protein